MKRLVLISLMVGCGGSVGKTKAPAVDASAAAGELRAGNFDSAKRESEKILAEEPDNAVAAAVKALSLYQGALHDASAEIRAVFDGAGDGFDHKRMRGALERLSNGLAKVDRSLEIASKDEGFYLELCLACWERDWNHSGEVDDRDRLLFQIEVGEDGALPEDSPRRRPTFRFDTGDVHWARAMVSFQHAFIELLLAYKWSTVESQIKEAFRGSPREFRLPLGSRERVATAKKLISEGIEHSLLSRAAYLAEVDDDREWVPNPRQKDHPMPLPVDAALYETWGALLLDVKGLLSGEFGISAEQVAQLGDHVWKTPPTGFVDVGRMLSEPKDIVIELGNLEGLDPESSPDAFVRSFLGDYYVAKMKPSKLPLRLLRMKRDLDTGSESLERKMRYLFWLN